MDSSTGPFHLWVRNAVELFDNSSPVVNGRLTTHGPTLISVGLVVLVANTYSPAVPVVSGMALITLGAVLAVASRFRCSPVLPALIAAHLLVYSTLYLLFIGAVLHGSFVKSSGGLSSLQSLDLALSVVPIGATLRTSVSAIAGGRNAPTP